MSREERERVHDILEAVDTIRGHAAVAEGVRPERKRIDEIVDQHLDPLDQAVGGMLAEIGDE